MKIIGELLELPQLVYHSYFHQVPKKYDNCERQMNLLTLILSLLKRAMASSSRNALVGTQSFITVFERVRVQWAQNLASKEAGFFSFCQTLDFFLKN